MIVIGLAGGIACGKSKVAECFVELGAYLIDADKIGHEVLCDPKVIEEIDRRWGSQVVTDGIVDRKALAKIVFPVGSDLPTPDLSDLEQLTHPEIGNLVHKQIVRLRITETTPAVVLDAPVMFKANWDQFCDRIVFIDADLETRKQRAAERGWAEKELERRESKQTPLSLKRKKSTDRVNNSGSIEELWQQVKQLWRTWKLPA